ncbi:RNA-binding ATPase activator esf2 [Ciborinia camelliae]|nr:RNA-binding ATPase activator esf2 [Ciborinia camelliae]
MSTRKHNDFLDLEDSDGNESQGYDSEAEDLRKGGRSLKRRKVKDNDQSDDDDEDEDIEQNSDQEEKDLEDEVVKEASKDIESKSKKISKELELPGVSRPLTKKNLVASAAAIKKSGVVYLSRIPPFMKPTKLRSLLEPFGDINRIFLTPEDPASHTRRVRNGGNKKRSFVDGWVEFVNKANAKKVCELLNAKTIGGKKGNYYHDDVWNLLYLKGFKWNNLTEQIAAENAERTSRMRAEISKTTKENKEFVQNVERAKIMEGMEAKKAAKRRKDEDGDGDVTKDGDMETKKQKTNADRPMRFKQNAPALKSKTQNQPDQVKRVLSKIF